MIKQKIVKSLIIIKVILYIYTIVIYKVLFNKLTRKIYKGICCYNNVFLTQPLGIIHVIQKFNPISQIN